MTTPVDQSTIHCNNCGYEGKVHASGAKQFILFLVLLVSSAYFLPMIVAALAYMVWILAQPPKRMCPQCKSTDISPAAAKTSEDKSSPAADK